MKPVKAGKRQLRSFGLIVGAGFTVIGLWPLVFRSEGPRTSALTLAVVLVAAALAFPAILEVPYRVWMAIGLVLGWINTRIILGLVYYGLFVPIGLFLRVTGHDPMGRRFRNDLESYRVLRTKRPGSHMQRQY